MTTQASLLLEQIKAVNSMKKTISPYKPKPLGGGQSKGIPWDKGAMTVKKYLEKEYRDKKTIISVLNRAGANLKDPKKIRVKDQVYKAFQEKSGKKEPGNPREPGTAKPTGIQPKTPKPHLDKVLNKKRPKISEKDHKAAVELSKKIEPQMKKRVGTFKKKHPILTKTLKGAAIGGVAALAATAAVASIGGGAAAILPVMMAKGAMMALGGAMSGARAGLTLGVLHRG